MMGAGIHALGASLGDFVARGLARPSARFANRTVPSRTASAALMPHDIPADAPAAPRHGDEVVTSRELVMALHRSAIGRLVMLSADAEQGGLGGVELGRAIARAGMSCILIDLTGEERIAAETGIAPGSPSLHEFAENLVPLGEIIHRDSRGGCHVVLATGAAPEPDSPDVTLVLAACAEAYDCTIVALDARRMDDLPSLLDEETAIVVAGQAATPDGYATIAGDLRALGVDDLIFMQCAATRRAGRRAPDKPD
ncbi:hypothetical protein [Aurantimonas sp.]|uniref:hypothetical protein n=1 Tax=Aurantimonas sp. TaxID=1872654 RepID=UPI003517409F